MTLIKGGKFNVHNSFNALSFRRHMRGYMASDQKIARRKK